MKKLVFLLLLGVFMIACSATKKKDVIILLGPPGAGKGTHAMNLSKTLSLPHISTGDLFRENISKNTPLGQKAKEFTDQGLLVPDEIVLGMLFDRISQEDCKKGYILDGFPRTVEQAKSLEVKLTNSNTLIFNLEIDDNPLIERITNRLVCKNCSAIFHKTFNPPKQPNICDNCGNTLCQRPDDSEEVVIKRLQVYHKQTKPIINYYKSRKNFYEINADASREDIFNQLLQIINQSK